jgi:membrane associated rhomboid family serine protease
MNVKNLTVDFNIDHIKDQSYKIIVGIILAGFVITWVPDELGSLLHLPALHKFGNDLFEAGVLNPSAEWSQPWRFVTSMFLHGGLLHIGLNLLALWFFHQTMKAEFHKSVWLAVFLIGGIVGGVLQLAISSEECVGASGGIMAMWGAAFAASIRYRDLPEDDRPWQHDLSIKWMLQNIALQVGLETVLAVSGIASIGHGAHAGGFMVGMAIGFVVPLIEQPAVLVSRFKAFKIDHVTFARTKGVKRVQGAHHLHIAGVTFETTDEFDADRDYLVVASKVRFFRKDRYWYHQIPAGGHLAFHPGLGEKRALTSTKISPAYKSQVGSLDRANDIEMIEVTQN